MITFILDLILHFDKYLIQILSLYGIWAYLVLFLVVFCETGLVVTPFLPGDSLIFTAGTLCAVSTSPLDINLLILILIIASWLGNQCNYHIGAHLGLKLLRSSHRRWINPQYMLQAQAFYQTHGASTLLLARFIPVIRTFAPFVAGVAQMNLQKFILMNMVSAVLWISSLSLMGYGFGQQPWVQEHLSLMIYSIVLLSLLPGIYSWAQHFKKNTKVL
jgi:membrane-associated protein